MPPASLSLIPRQHLSYLSGLISTLVHAAQANPGKRLIALMDAIDDALQDALRLTPAGTEAERALRGVADCWNYPSEGTLPDLIVGLGRTAERLRAVVERTSGNPLLEALYFPEPRGAWTLGAGGAGEEAATSAKAGPPPPRRKNAVRRNKQRDAWVARQREKTPTQTWEEIYDALVEIAHRKKWSVPNSAKSLSEAYYRHLKRTRSQG